MKENEEARIKCITGIRVKNQEVEEFKCLGYFNKLSEAKNSVI